MNIKAIFSAVVFALASTVGVHASAADQTTTTDLGTLTPYGGGGYNIINGYSGQLGNFAAGTGTYSNTFTFSLGAADAGGFANIVSNWGTHGTYNAGAGDVALSLSATLNGQSFNYDLNRTHSLASVGLLSGTNTLVVQGTGALWGTYNFWVGGSSPVTPVPEPETFALLLAGLGVVGFATRRRRTHAALAA